MRTTKIGPYLRLPSVQITVLTFLVKKKKYNEACRCVLSPNLKVMLLGTIRNDDF